MAIRQRITTSSGAIASIEMVPTTKTMTTKGNKLVEADYQPQLWLVTDSDGFFVGYITEKELFYGSTKNGILETRRKGTVWCGGDTERCEDVDGDSREEVVEHLMVMAQYY